MSKETKLIEFLMIILLFLIVLFGPQITEFSKGMTPITGRAVEINLDLNVSVSSRTPIIQNVNMTLGQPPSQSITLNSVKKYNFSFLGCDLDGTSGLLAYANLTGPEDTISGKVRRVDNITCLADGVWTNTTCKRFNCSMEFWYWYQAGSDWNLSVNVTDGESWAHSNTSNFALGSTSGIQISPSSINWSGLNMGDSNKTSATDPILINNTGNYNVSRGDVNITAWDLIGEETPGEYIPAINFTVDTDTGGNCAGDQCVECDGNNMVNATTSETSTLITNSTLPKGNHSANDNQTAQENLFFCIRQVPAAGDISVQAYSTEAQNQWVVGVSD